MKKLAAFGLAAALCLLCACAAPCPQEATTELITAITTLPSTIATPPGDDLEWFTLSSSGHREEAQAGLGYLLEVFGLSGKDCEVFFTFRKTHDKDDWLLYCRGEEWKGTTNDGTLFAITQDATGYRYWSAIAPRRLFYDDEKNAITVQLQQGAPRAIDPWLMRQVKYLELKKAGDDLYALDYDLNHDGKADRIIYLTDAGHSGSAGHALKVVLAGQSDVVDVATVRLLESKNGVMLPIIPNPRGTDTLVLEDVLWAGDHYYAGWYVVDMPGYQISEVNTISIEYPSFPEYSAAVNQMIKEVAYSVLDGYDDPDWNIEFDIRYEVMQKTKHFVSIAFYGTTYLHSAPHPHNHFYTLNLDVKTGKKIRLADRVTIDEAFATKVRQAVDALESGYGEYYFNHEFEDDSKLLDALRRADSESYGVYSYFKPDKIGIVLPTSHGLGEHCVEIVNQ